MERSRCACWRPHTGDIRGGWGIRDRPWTPKLWADREFMISLGSTCVQLHSRRYSRFVLLCICVLGIPLLAFMRNQHLRILFWTEPAECGFYRCFIFPRRFVWFMCRFDACNWITVSLWLYTHWIIAYNIALFAKRELLSHTFPRYVSILTYSCTSS